MIDWREIRCADLDWHGPQGNRRVAYFLERQTGTPTDWMKQHQPDVCERSWSALTLGELADRGELWWSRSGEHIGKAGIEAIKTMIDRAAAGYEVRKNSGSANAYHPREIDPPPPELERKS